MTFVLGPLFAVFEGFALKTLWAWFLVPLGLPAIGLAHAVGVAALIGLVTHQTPATNDDEHTARVLVFGAISPGGALVVGWIAKSFM